MPSSPPAPATENDEVVEAVEIEAPGPGHAAESVGTEVEGGAAANHTVSSPQEDANVLNDDPDVYYEDTEDDEHDDIASNVEHDNIAYDDDDYTEDDLGDVDDNYFDEEGGKFSESAEVEATLEALWCKVVAVEEKPSAGHTCSVCMEQLTCEGAHRICCIPCGHVYGRSCLERWLRRNGEETARCPQCKVMFAENHIINLYAPVANLWEGCGRVQEVKVYVKKAMGKVLAQHKNQIKATRAQASSDMKKFQDLLVTVEEQHAAEMQEQHAEIQRVKAAMETWKEFIEEQMAASKPSPSLAKPAELQEDNAPLLQ